MLYYKMVRKTPVESAVWIPETYIRGVIPLDVTDVVAAVEALMPGWECVGYNVREVEPGGTGC